MNWLHILSAVIAVRQFVGRRFDVTMTGRFATSRPTIHALLLADFRCRTMRNTTQYAVDVNFSLSVKTENRNFITRQLFSNIITSRDSRLLFYISLQYTQLRYVQLFNKALLHCIVTLANYGSHSHIIHPTSRQSPW